ncbi:hypothetical protein AB0D04_30600 [Streptomyces sp. NPDC048483]|uniref:hypothetical protein n=1 Tax=Streptomyces sp. NPDC048483 TaxID=3154927 RepID=UPI00341D2531
MKAHATAPAEGPPAKDTEQEPAWRRLSPRMLAVHPLHEALRFLPVVLGVFLFGRDGEKPWGLIGLVLAQPPVLAGRMGCREAVGAVRLLDG